MIFFRNLRNEWRTFVASPLKFFVPSAITAIVGVLVWLSCDGISLVWKTSYHPSFCILLWMMFSLWTVTYILFGILISMGRICSLGGELCLKAVIGYVAGLFWCPLTLLAGGGLCGVFAIVASIAYTAYIMKLYCKISILGLLCSLTIVIYEVYMLFFTMGFTIIN